LHCWMARFFVNFFSTITLSPFLRLYVARVSICMYTSCRASKQPRLSHRGSLPRNRLPRDAQPRRVKPGQTLLELRVPA
jgi:hypothetical protein